VEIFKLFGSIFIDNEEANKSIAKTEEKAESLGSKLGNGVKTAAKWGAAIVGGATAAVGGLIAVTNQTAEYADEIDKLSERTGINREELQRWKYAASQSGADIGKLETGMKKLSDVMADAMNGNEKAAESFAALGISIDDLKNKSQEEIFSEVMNSLADMEQGAVRNALGNDLLGKSYTEMLPLLNAGSEGMKELRDRADELGIVMSEDMVKANVKFGDTMADVKDAFGGIVRELTNAALPMLQSFLDFILEHMPQVRSVLSSVFGTLSNVVAAVLPLLMNLIEQALPPLIDLFTQVANDVLPPVISLLSDIIQSVLPILIDLFSSIATTILPPLIDLLKMLVNDVLPPLIDLFMNVVEAVLPPLMDLFKTLINTLLPPLITLFKQVIDAVLPVLIELFNQFTDTVLPPLMELINEIVAVIMPPLLDIFNELAEVVLPLVMEVFQALLPVIEPIMNMIAAVIKTALSLIKGDWEGVWNGIRDFFSAYLDYIIELVEGFKNTFGAIFDAIGKHIENVWDGIVGNIKGAINYIIGAINAFIRGVNNVKVPDWVPGVGGKGINIKEIPMLVKGGEIIQRGHAIVGEAGPELLELPQGAKVKPLNNNNKEVATEVNNNFNIANLVVREEADIKKIARELKKLQDNKRGGVAFA
jgi:hypothetical protein